MPNLEQLNKGLLLNAVPKASGPVINMNETSYQNPVVGKDIAWKEVEDYFFRVIKFTPIARIVGNEIQAPESHLPYAIVTVECLELDQELVVLISHRLDFRNLWKAFNERGISEQEEVIIGDFASKRSGFVRIFGSFLPRLFVWVCRKGHLERLVHDDWGGLTGEAWAEAFMPLERWEPET